MQLLVVLAAVTTLCSGSAISDVPGDNNHYVEGESRYIWMPDGDGVPHLVDLEASIGLGAVETPGGANNQYWLFTRENPNNPQIIVSGNASSIGYSNYNGGRPLKVIVHGWCSNGWSDVNTLITAAFLDVQDCNVIVVDWSQVAYGLYILTVSEVPGVGHFLGNFLEWLINTGGGNWNNVHIVGFSLGAHVVGNAGRTTGGRPARITGLDPAGPLWRNNSYALNGNDGQYVEVIHTDGGFLGIFDPIGNANFYPNGGRHPQPGCWISICSHSRATELFASSIRFNNFTGRQCTDIDQVSNLSSCTSSVLIMGNDVITKRGSGIYGLTTKSSWPF